MNRIGIYKHFRREFYVQVIGKAKFIDPWEFQQKFPLMDLFTNAVAIGADCRVNVMDIPRRNYYILDQRNIEKYIPAFWFQETLILYKPVYSDGDQAHKLSYRVEPYVNFVAQMRPERCKYSKMFNTMEEFNDYLRNGMVKSA